MPGTAAPSRPTVDLPAAFGHVTTWIFDLDNTLYPAHTNLFRQIDDRIRTFVARLLDLSHDDAQRVQKDLYHRYGTSLRGLMTEHGIAPDDFLEYVHDIDHSVLAPDPALAAAIAALPGRRFIMTNGTRNLFALIQSIDAFFNVTILIAATAFSLFTLETRLIRARAAKSLHPLRAIVHVIDMHQLTKDPSFTVGTASMTPVSPRRELSPFELTRYLDYCSEMLSLTAKLAALFALATDDPSVGASVNEIESLTANLSHKIWQKIMIVHSTAAASPLNGR